MQLLTNKNILLGITGGIAAYKSADLARRLREAGATVRIAMTENAKRFITPLTMQAVSGHSVHDDLFDLNAEAAMGHIELARWADLILVAPASASFIARLAHGFADDLLSTLCLATQAPIAIAPAMNQVMWENTNTQANVQALQQQNVFIVGPADGLQACGEVGPGRLLEPADIVTEISALFTPGLLAGKHVLITAGPTQEAIDPVRYLSNGSSGKMGYALAAAARDAGAKVTLISGPVHVSVPTNVDCVRVTTAEEMHAAVMRNIGNYDIFFAVAAVSDYRPETVAKQKIHKQDAVSELRLVRNPDIVASVGALQKRPLIVGFAAETNDMINSAKAKRLRKKMDVIVANHVQDGMGGDNNAVVVIDADGETVLPRESKQQLARRLIEMIGSLDALFASGDFIHGCKKRIQATSIGVSKS